MRFFYIIYTSGSTGSPKGVRVTCGNLDSFGSWMTELFPKPPAVIINQAAFSFDLSVADLWPAFAWGAEEYVICRQTQKNYPLLFSRLEHSRGELMVTTPSFASLLLADKSFCKTRLPDLNAIFFLRRIAFAYYGTKTSGAVSRHPDSQRLWSNRVHGCGNVRRNWAKRGTIAALPVGKPKTGVETALKRTESQRWGGDGRNRHPG